MKRLFLATLLVCYLVLPARAQVQLAWKMADEQQLTTVLEIDSQQRLTINARDINTASKQQRVVKRTAGKRHADGNIQVETKVDSLKATLNLPGDVTIEFDSTKENEPGEGPMRTIVDLLKLTADIQYSATYGSDNRVVAVQIPDELLKSLSDEARKLVEGQLDTEAIKEALNEELGQIPSHEVAPGDHWERSNKMRLEAGQVLAFKSEATYQGTVREQGRTLDKITTKATEVTYHMDPNSASPLKLKSSELEVEDQGGMILFDRQLGQVVKSEDSVRITGSIMFDLNGTDLPADLDLRLKTSQTTR